MIKISYLTISEHDKSVQYDIATPHSFIELIFVMVKDTYLLTVTTSLFLCKIPTDPHPTSLLNSRALI